MSCELELYTTEVKAEMKARIISALYEAGGEVVNAIKSFCRVDTGKTRDSFTYSVDENDLRVSIGSNFENAIWEEFGTGIYAVNGDGRKTPWVYTDRNGKTRITHGKKPQRMLQKGFEKMKPMINDYFAKMLGGM